MASGSGNTSCDSPDMAAHERPARGDLISAAAGLAAEPFAARLGRGDTGADALLDQLTLKLGDACQHGRDHAAVQRREIKRHAVQRDHRHAPRLQFIQALVGIRGGGSGAG